MRVMWVLTLAFFLGADASHATDASGTSAANVMRAPVTEPVSFSSPPEDPAVDVSIDPGNDVFVQTVTFAPGATAGWHFHPIVGGIVTVTSGTLTLEEVAEDEASRCFTSAGPGTIISEAERHIHNAWNLGPVPVVLQIMFILRSANVSRVSVPDPYTGNATNALPPPAVQCR
jgi:hypothetical protein